MRSIEVDTKYGPMWAYKGDHITNILQEAGCYEQKYVDTFIKNVANEKATVLDVGAHIGTFTLPFEQSFRTVIAFEPNEAAYKLLCKNIPPSDNVILFNKAAGHYNGPATIKELDPKNTGNTSLYPEGDVVDMITIDSLKLEACHGIKIDVEGAEGLVLYGAQETIEKHRPVIMYEHTRLNHFLEKNHIENFNFDILEFFGDMRYKRLIPFNKNIIAIP